MREDICSIPINEVFEPKDGCPYCRMRDMLEDRMATYITGAAMMEPDVRVETNRLGFCETHMKHILERGSRLSVALILQTLLDADTMDILPDDAKINIKKTPANADRREKSCFVCENIVKNIEHFCSTVLKLWQNEPEFRKLYSEQTHICLKHYNMIQKTAEKKMPKKVFADFSKENYRLARNYMDTLRHDIGHFCNMFDYRSKGKDWGNSRDAIERSIEFITSRKPDTTTKTEGKNR